MTEKRLEQIKKEAERRINLWLENDTFENMTCYYSRLRFNMSVGLLGYPFEKEKWMKPNDFKPFINDEEWNDPEFDIMMDDLFDKNYN